MLTRSLLGAAMAAALCACGGEPSNQGAGSEVIQVDGSSTVFPLSEAAAEGFGAQRGAAHAFHHLAARLPALGGLFKSALARRELRLAWRWRSVFMSGMVLAQGLRLIHRTGWQREDTE